MRCEKWSMVAWDIDFRTTGIPGLTSVTSVIATEHAIAHG